MDNSSSAGSHIKSITPAAIGIPFLCVLGIAYPLITLYFEMSSRMCAAEYFDPIPTLLHVALVALTPLATLAAIVFYLAPVPPTFYRPFAVLVGAGLASAGFYALVFLPLTPLAVFAIVFAGLGLLPLAPLVTFISLLVGSMPLVIGKAGEGRRAAALGWVGAGVGVGLGLLIYADYSANRVVHLAAAAMSNNPDRRAAAVDSLRNDPIALRALATMTQSEWRPVLGPLSLMATRKVGTVEGARTVWFLVTGTSWATLPENIAERRLLFDDFDFSTNDAMLGGRDVGNVINHLSLAQARLDGDVHAASGVAYLEWTMEFNNATAAQAEEARLRLALPPDAVVSRLTLWVNGEPREAAFDLRNKVTAAYQQVAVRERRDPVLVTASGPDEVLVQCFPVPASGTMKIRLGITAPLVPEVGSGGGRRGWLTLPYVTERNFVPPSEVANALDLRLDAGVAQSPTAMIASEGRLLSRGHFDQLQTIAFDLAPLAPVMLAESRNAETVIEQQLAESSIEARKLHVVIDAGLSSAPAADEVKAALGALVNTTPATFYIAGDKPLEATSAREALVVLNQIGFEGGRDNGPCLSEAWFNALAAPGSAVVWLHGAQHARLSPIELPGADMGRVPVYTHRLVQGRNVLAEELEQRVHVRRLPRRSLDEPLGEVLGRLARGGSQLAYERRQRQRIEVADADISGSSHIARLWAADQVRAQLGRGAKAEGEAAELAQLYQLVTPLTGAVVLETQAQYARAGLEAVDPSTVPAVPEPSLWVMVALLAVLGVGVLAFTRRRGRPQPV